MTESPQAWLDRADEALDEARILLDRERARGALSRAYCATFYAARAALATVGEQPKTHAGTHNRFALHFVKSGRLSTSVGELLPDAFEARQRVDYEAVSVYDTRAASDALADAEAFVAAVRPLVAAPEG